MATEKYDSANVDLDTSSERSWWCGTPDNLSPTGSFLGDSPHEYSSTEEGAGKRSSDDFPVLEFRDTLDSTEALLSLLLEGWPTVNEGVVRLPCNLWTTFGHLVRELVRRVNFQEEQLERAQVEWQAMHQDKMLAKKQLEVHISQSIEAMRIAEHQKAVLQQDVQTLRMQLETAQSALDVQQARLEEAETHLRTFQLQQLRPSREREQKLAGDEADSRLRLQRSLQHEREVNKKLQMQRRGLVSAHKHGQSLAQLSLELKASKEETHTVLMLNNALEDEMQRLRKELSKATASAQPLSSSLDDTTTTDQTTSTTSSGTAANSTTTVDNVVEVNSSHRTNVAPAIKDLNPPKHTNITSSTKAMNPSKHTSSTSATKDVIPSKHIDSTSSTKDTDSTAATKDSNPSKQTNVTTAVKEINSANLAASSIISDVTEDVNLSTKATASPTTGTPSNLKKKASSKKLSSRAGKTGPAKISSSVSAVRSSSTHTPTPVYRALVDSLPIAIPTSTVDSALFEDAPATPSIEPETLKKLKVTSKTAESRHGKSVAMLGRSGAARSKSGVAHDRSDAAHDTSDDAHGNSDAPHDMPDAPHGTSDAPHDHSDAAHKKSDTAHEKSDASHDKSDAPHDKSHEAHDTAHDRSDPAHGTNSDAAHSRPGTVICRRSPADSSPQLSVSHSTDSISSEAQSAGIHATVVPNSGIFSSSDLSGPSPQPTSPGAFTDVPLHDDAPLTPQPSVTPPTAPISSATSTDGASTEHTRSCTLSAISSLADSSGASSKLSVSSAAVPALHRRNRVTRPTNPSASQARNRRTAESSHVGQQSHDRLKSNKQPLPKWIP